jgi:hypothetical protein
MRTHSGTNYTTMRLSQNLPIQQTTRFSIPRRSDDYKPSGTEVAALNLLQARSSPAIIVYQGPCYIVSELGMPNIFVVPEGSDSYGRLLTAPCIISIANRCNYLTPYNN